jgi:hypothetical protein
VSAAEIHVIVARKARAAVPNIRTVEGLRQMLLAAKSIAYFDTWGRARRGGRCTTAV